MRAVVLTTCLIRDPFSEGLITRRGGDARAHSWTAVGDDGRETTELAHVATGGGLDDRNAERESQSPHRWLRLGEQQDRMVTLVAAEKETILKQQAAIEALLTEQSSIVAKERQLESQQKETAAELNALGANRSFLTQMSADPVVSDVFVSLQPSRFWTREYLIGSSVHFVFIAICALIWRQCGNLQIEAMPFDDEERVSNGFQFQLCDCGLLSCSSHHMMTSFCAMCFSSIQWADTASSVGARFLPFWPAVLIFEILLLLGGASACGSALALLVLCIWCRQRIRSRYRMESGTCSTLCVDTCAWMLCPCCALVQEARQVKEVKLPSDKSEHGERQPAGSDGPLDG